MKRLPLYPVSSDTCSTTEPRMLSLMPWLFLIVWPVFEKAIAEVKPEGVVDLRV